MAGIPPAAEMAIRWSYETASLASSAIATLASSGVAASAPLPPTAAAAASAPPSSAPPSGRMERRWTWDRTLRVALTSSPSSLALPSPTGRGQGVTRVGSALGRRAMTSSQYLEQESGKRREVALRTFFSLLPPRRRLPWRPGRRDGRTC